MDKLTISKAEIINQCRLHRQRPVGNRSTHDQRYVMIKDGNGVIQCEVKMGSVLEAEILQGELDWMIHLEYHFKSDLVRIVKGYCIVEDGIWRLLVKEHLQGQLMWDVIGQGDTALSEADADMIAMAIMELRDHPGLYNSLQAFKLTPSTSWYPQGFIFFCDNDGGRLITDTADFIKFMTNRFERAGISIDTIPLTPRVFTFGEASPYTMVKLPGGGLGLLDFEMTFFGPLWWEGYALHAANEIEAWETPLKKAYQKFGLDVPSAIADELDYKFRPYFLKWGSPQAR